MAATISLTTAQRDLLCRALTPHWDGIIPNHGTHQKTLDALVKHGLIERGFRIIDQDRRDRLKDEQYSFVAGAVECISRDWREAARLLAHANGRYLELAAVCWRINDAGRALVSEVANAS